MAHIRRLKTGRYQVRYRDPTNRERARNFARRADAERYMHTIEADKITGRWTDPARGRVLFGDWARDVEASRINRRESTAVRDDSCLRNLVLPHLGDMPLHSIGPRDLQQWIVRLDAEGYAAATVRKAFQIAARALRAAHRDRMIAELPTHDIALPSIPETDRRFLSAEEVAALADGIDPRFRALVLTAAATGLRFGELAGLSAEDVNLLRRTLRVERTLAEVKGKLSLSDPKTQAARRTVTISTRLAAEIDAHLAQHPDPTGIVFSAPQGGYLRRTGFRRRFWLPAVRASVGEPLRFHDLRHTHAALLIKHGEHPKAVAARLGHRSVRTVLDVYGHMYEGFDRAAAEAIETELWLSLREARAGGPITAGA